jgi:hypothetical protein
MSRHAVWKGRDFVGDGMRVIRPLPLDSVEKYARRRLMRRLVEDGERRYTAYSAEELLEIDSRSAHARPGMPY